MLSSGLDTLDRAGQDWLQGMSDQLRSFHASPAAISATSVPSAAIITPGRAVGGLDGHAHVLRVVDGVERSAAHAARVVVLGALRGRQDELLRVGVAVRAPVLGELGGHAEAKRGHSASVAMPTWP